MPETKDTVINLEDRGSIRIADDVVCTIIAMAVSEVEGVALMHSGGSGASDALSRKNLAKGVKIQTEDAVIHVDVYVLVRYGYTIPTLAQKVQERIKSSIDSMTGLSVGNINVHVGGVTFDHEAKAK